MRIPPLKNSGKRFFPYPHRRSLAVVGCRRGLCAPKKKTVGAAEAGSNRLEQGDFGQYSGNRGGDGLVPGPSGRTQTIASWLGKNINNLFQKISQRPSLEVERCQCMGV